MDLIVPFLTEEPCPMTKPKQKKLEEKHHDIGSRRNRSYTNIHTQALIYYASTLRQSKHC